MSRYRQQAYLLTAHDMAGEECFVTCIDTGSLGRIETANKNAVFRRNRRGNVEPHQQKVASMWFTRDRSSLFRRNRVWSLL